MKRRARVVALGTVLTAGLYLLLIDTTSLPELYAMAGVVLLAVLALAASLERGFTEAAIRGRFLRRAYRPVLQVPGHIWLLLAETADQIVHRRASRGQFRAVSFAAGDEPDDIGRRALSEILGSLAPNTIVIGVDTERQLLLVHQLHRTGTPEDLDVLGLGSR
jgi:hypothetical protein